MNPLLLHDITRKLEANGFSVSVSECEDILVEHPLAGSFNLGALGTAYSFLLGYQVGRVVKSVDVLAAPAPVLAGCVVREEIP